MPKQTKSYIELSNQLDVIISRLEDPETTIDDALNLYKDGDKLVSQLKNYLENKHNEIRLLNNKGE